MTICISGSDWIVVTRQPWQPPPGRCEDSLASGPDAHRLQPLRGHRVPGPRMSAYCDKPNRSKPDIVSMLVLHQ